MYKSDEKRRAYARTWAQANRETRNARLQQRTIERRAWVYEQLGNRCVSCGATENLHVDHIDPATKTFSFGQHWRAPIEVLLAELPKCQLLCKPCHIQKTMERHEYHAAPLHGTSTMYGAPHRCRCDACRLWKRNYDIDWKLRRKAQALGSS